MARKYQKPPSTSLVNRRACPPSSESGHVETLGRIAGNCRLLYVRESKCLRASMLAGRLKIIRDIGASSEKEKGLAGQKLTELPVQRYYGGRSISGLLPLWAYIAQASILCCCFCRVYRFGLSETFGYRSAFCTAVLLET